MYGELDSRYPKRKAPSGSKTHVLILGLAGIAVVLFCNFALALVGDNIGEGLYTILSCATNLAIPIGVGFLAARTGFSNGSANSLADGALQGGMASLVTGGFFSLSCGACMMAIIALAEDSLNDIGLSFTDIISETDAETEVGQALLILCVGLIGFTLIYGAFGLLGGVFAALTKGVS